MSNNQNTPPGLIQPTVASLPPGSSNPRDAAIIQQQNANAKQLSINQISSGGRRRRRFRGGADPVPVPQFQMQYTPTGGPGSSPNNIIADSSQTSMQSTANAVSDNQATKMGGSRRRCKKGGNSDWIWGCYSGGKRRTKRRNTRKNKRKSRRHRRH